MNKDRVELFLAALESGKYTQCTGHLRQQVLFASMILEQRHCALGVATEVALDNGLREELRTMGYNGDEFLFTGGRLHEWVMQWYGFEHTDPLLTEPARPDSHLTTVSRLNDGGKDFWTIAQMGREQWLKDQGEQS